MSEERLFRVAVSASAEICVLAKDRRQAEDLACAHVDLFAADLVVDDCDEITTIGQTFANEEVWGLDGVTAAQWLAAQKGIPDYTSIAELEAAGQLRLISDPE